MKKLVISSVLALSFATTAAMAGSPVETVKTSKGVVFASAKTGMTLYTFRKDKKNLSVCYNDCAQAWPPFHAGGYAKAQGDLGITKRKDGSQQWTWKGQPLYFWAGDQNKGDVTGDGVGGVWDALRK